MSERWPGGIVRATPVTPTGPLQNGTAPGVWTLDQANYWIKQGLWPTAGNFLAVEDVFSTWLYTGNGSTQTITNGINLSGQGGLVWIKDRNNTGDPKNHYLYDTVRGTSVSLSSNTTSGNLSTSGIQLTAFNNNGFSLGSSSNVNQNTFAHVAWTFREAANFFDVVTYTGNGSTQNIAHSLGVEPGMIIVKSTSYADDWTVYHRSLGASFRLFLNATNAATNTFSAEGWGNNTTTVAPTATQFTIGDFGNLNSNGQTYVAYLFAHDTSSTGLIQCGSFNTSGSSTINLGWEPQWLMIKRSSNTSSWFVFDNMRGVATGGNDADLNPNTSDAEASVADWVDFTATGFNERFGNSQGTGDYIYIAIRRGPMRTPTSGTSVFNTNFASGGPPNFVPNFVVDLGVSKNKTSSTIGFRWASRLTSQGAGAYLTSSDTTAEATSAPYGVFGSNTGWYGTSALTSSDFFSYSFRRAPSFMDVVCYTGTGVARTVNHNLGVAPEMIIVKSRTQAGTYWMVQHSALGPTKDIYLQLTNAASTRTAPWNDTAPTSTVFTVGTDSDTNGSGQNLVAYLFASCPGVSKVGSYTGTGALQTINCGFTTGARFVLIKRTDSTGDWYVWDSARGISSGNDPYLLLNSTAAEVTGTNYVDTDTTGFKVTAAAPAALNANGGTYIFLAVA